MSPGSFEQAFVALLYEKRFALPAVVETYDFETARASVRPVIREVYPDGQELAPPIIPSCPVVWPRAGGAIIHLPIKPGDFVFLVVSDRSIERFVGEGVETTPGDPRLLDLTDAVVFPGFFPFTETTEIDNGDDVIIRFAEAVTRIKPDGEVNVDTPARFVVTAADSVEVATEGDAIVTASGDIEATASGNALLMASGDVEVSGTNATVSATSSANVTAAQIDILGMTTLGGPGGVPIALVGDAVAGGVITGPGATMVTAV